MYDLIYIYEFEGNLGPRVRDLADEDYISFWKEAGYSFLFYRKEKKDLWRRLSLPYRSELVIRHQDWEAGTSLDVLQVGSLTLHPPWKVPPAGSEPTICLDPGMAFGSGYHGSTKGSLFMLQKLFRSFVPEKVLDLGTGSGILSIAALKMGAGVAYSLDYNNLSTDTAQKNRNLNGLEERMHLWRADVRHFLHIPADLLMANIHFQVIDQITDQEEFYSKKYYLLAGLIGHEGAVIEEKLNRRLRLMDRYQENFWFSYLWRHPQDREE